MKFNGLLKHIVGTGAIGWLIFDDIMMNALLFTAQVGIGNGAGVHLWNRFSIIFYGIASDSSLKEST